MEGLVEGADERLEERELLKLALPSSNEEGSVNGEGQEPELGAVEVLSDRDSKLGGPMMLQCTI